MNDRIVHLGDVVADALQQGHPVAMRVVSGSMRPTLRVGDYVYVAPISSAHVRVGDVVVLDIGNELLTHRLLGWQGEIPLTKGDASLVPDTFPRPPRLLGRVIGYERCGRYHDWQGRYAQWGHMLLGQVGYFVLQCQRLLRLSPVQWLAHKVMRVCVIACVYGFRL